MDRTTSGGDYAVPPLMDRPHNKSDDSDEPTGFLIMLQTQHFSARHPTWRLAYCWSIADLLMKRVDLKSSVRFFPVRLALIYSSPGMQYYDIRYIRCTVIVVLGKGCVALNMLLVRLNKPSPRPLVKILYSFNRSVL